MATSFKFKLATLISENKISSDTSFIFDVFRHLEIEHYLNFFIEKAGFVISKDENNNNIYSDPNNNELNKYYFNQIIQMSLELFEYCNVNKLKLSDTRSSLIAILIRQYSVKFNKSLIDDFIEFHSTIKPHKQLTEEEFNYTVKIIQSRQDNKKLFPLDMVTDCEMLTFIQLETEKQRQNFITSVWNKYHTTFSDDYKKRNFAFKYPDIEWIYFNFRFFFISFKWNSSWSKHKAFVTNWNAISKKSIAIFQKESLQLEDSDISKFQNL